MRQCILWFEAFKYNLSVGQKPFALVKHFTYLCFLSWKGSHIRLCRLHFLVIAICIRFWLKYAIWSEYIIRLPPVKKSIPFGTLTLKSSNIFVFAYKQCLIFAYFLSWFKQDELLTGESNIMNKGLVYVSQKQWFEHHQKLPKELCGVGTKSVDTYNAWK